MKIKKKRSGMKRDLLDALFSDYIRLRAMSRVGGCERCLSQKVSYKDLQCAHISGRGKMSTRWDADNAVGLCGGCHMYFTAQPFEFTAWATKYLGQDKLDMLQARSRTLAHDIDKSAITVWLKQEIKKLEV